MKKSIEHQRRIPSRNKKRFESRKKEKASQKSTLEGRRKFSSMIFQVFYLNSFSLYIKKINDDFFHLKFLFSYYKLFCHFEPFWNFKRWRTALITFLPIFKFLRFTWSRFRYIFLFNFTSRRFFT